MLCYLIAYPDHINMADPEIEDYTALHYSAYYGHLDVARLLIQCKADIDAKNCLYNCRRHSCCYYFFVAKLCLRKLILFFSSQTPLYVAASEGQLEVARLLIQCKAEMDVGEYR